MKRLAPLMVTALLATLLQFSTAAPSHATEGWSGTPARNAACRAPLTAAQKQRLIELSNPSTLKSFAAAAPRVDEIAAILVGARDNRGIFAIFYQRILDQAVPAVAAGDFDDPVWVERVSLNFVREYLANLHGHLTGGRVTYSWQRYYALAADCQRTIGRVAGAALLAHLVIDFPKAIADARSTAANQADFFSIGNLLIEATNALTGDISAAYGQDLTDLFNLYSLGQGINDLAQANVITPVFFQSVRASAWVDGLKLTSPWTAWSAQMAMDSKWAAGSSTMNLMEMLGLV